MKKLLIIIFAFISFNAYAIEEKTTFSLEIFNEAQKNGKVVVINSWNKSCGTCAAQIIVLQEAKKEFKNILFLKNNFDGLGFIFKVKNSRREMKS